MLTFLAYRSGLPRLVRPPRPGPCLDFVFQYAHIRNNRSKKFGVEYWPCLAQIRRGIPAVKAITSSTRIILCAIYFLFFFIFSDYRTRFIVTRGLYIFLSHFWRPCLCFRGGFFRNCPYVWLYSRAIMMERAWYIVRQVYDVLRTAGTYLAWMLWVL